MKKIFLVRHGQDQDNAQGILNGRRDSPLTTTGHQQADLLADKVQENNLGVVKVFSSPLQRAYDTALEVTQRLNLEPPEKVELLIERDFGVMTGKVVKDIQRLCAPDIIVTGTITYFLSPPDAETFPQLIVRAKKFLSWLNTQSQPGNYLLVTHGDIGKMIFAAYYTLPWKEVLTDFHFGNSEILLLAPNTQPEDRHFHKTQQYNH